VGTRTGASKDSLPVQCFDPEPHPGGGQDYHYECQPLDPSLQLQVGTGNEQLAVSAHSVADLVGVGARPVRARRELPAQPPTQSARRTTPD
jgi:hypothetical protein